MGEKIVEKPDCKEEALALGPNAIGIYQPNTNQLVSHVSIKFSTLLKLSSLIFKCHSEAQTRSCFTCSV